MQSIVREVLCKIILTTIIIIIENEFYQYYTDSMVTLYMEKEYTYIRFGLEPCFGGLLPLSNGSCGGYGWQLLHIALQKVGLLSSDWWISCPGSTLGMLIT